MVAAVADVTTQTRPHRLDFFLGGGGASPCCKLYTQYTYMNTDSRIHGNTCARTHATHARTHTSTKTNKHSHTHKERKRACARALSLSHTYMRAYAACQEKACRKKLLFLYKLLFPQNEDAPLSRAYAVCQGNTCRKKLLFLYKLLFPQNEDAFARICCVSRERCYLHSKH